jgi:hypothetical protein
MTKEFQRKLHEKHHEHQMKLYQNRVGNEVKIYQKHGEQRVVGASVNPEVAPSAAATQPWVMRL